jgi:HK97 family phage prohead protease
MKIEIRADYAIIEGYVNAVGRDSRPLPTPRGRFLEQVVPKTFQKAIERAKNIELRFNHQKVLGSTTGGNLELREDNIGLYAKATITDAEVIEKARKKELRGWSFGFVKNTDRWETDPKGIERRYLEDIELREVSILDETPAYIGTSIEMRGENELVVEDRSIEDISEVTEVQEQRTEPINYDLYEKQIQILNLWR